MWKFRMAWKLVYILLFTSILDPVSLKLIGRLVSVYWTFKVLKSVIYLSNAIISNNITFMHMLKLATVDLIYHLEWKFIKQRVMHDSYRDNISPPLSSPMVYFNIVLYEDNFRTEESVPIDTMLKKN